MNFMLACDVQCKLMACGTDQLNIPDPKVNAQVQRMLLEGVNMNSNDNIKWGLGELEFESEMARLDSIVCQISNKNIYIYIYREIYRLNFFNQKIFYLYLNYFSQL